MIIGVPKETFPGEQRVALIPASISPLCKAGFEILIEKDAGMASGFPDRSYEEKGARILSTRAEVFGAGEIILNVLGLGANPNADQDLNLLHSGQVLIGFFDPLSRPEMMQKIAGLGVIAFALELLPRIARAQSMDALSSMGTIIGYKAVLLAAETLPKMFPMMTTAAGTIIPARVFVVGTGVAGLQAIATARSLGAVVYAYDIRPAAKEQVESLGAKFVELSLETAKAEEAGGYAKAMGEDFYQKQRELMAKVVAESDIVITTAVVPGKRPPLLITAEMVKGMEPGSVIVDVAAERGGNCELTRAGETAVINGVKIMGPINLASSVPYHASQMYSKNISNFINYLIKDDKLRLDIKDEIIRETMVCWNGEVIHPRIRELLATGIK